jgi:hypothetical protein
VQLSASQQFGNVADWYLQKARGGFLGKREHYLEALFAPRLEKISQWPHDNGLSRLNRD